MQAAPSLARAILEAGHEVGLHCHRHVRHSDLGEAEIEADTCAALATLGDLGIDPVRWRTPWGTLTPASVTVACRHALELVHWTHDTHDWRGDSATAMLASAQAALADGGVVLMHDAFGPGATREGCENTLAVIAPLSELAASRGLAVLPLSEVPVRDDARRAQQPAPQHHLHPDAPTVARGEGRCAPGEAILLQTPGGRW